MSAPRPFTREMLEAFARKRGEQIPSNPIWGETLLAYMRTQGMIDEHVDRKVAQSDFEQLVRHVDFEAHLPPQEPHEFPVFTRMRGAIGQLRQQHNQQIAAYKAKRDFRSEATQEPPPPPLPPPEKVLHKPSATLDKIKDLASTAWKSPRRRERER